MKKSQINCLETVGGSKFGYLCFVYMWSVSSVEVEAKSHWLLILVILTALIVLSTKFFTEMVILEV